MLINMFVHREGILMVETGKTVLMLLFSSIHGLLILYFVVYLLPFYFFKT